MITLQQLQCFVVSADTGSFSEAASVLYTTQSNISRMISSMEKELGGSVFIRSAHGIRLNEKGKQLYGHAVKVLREMDAFTNAAEVSADHMLAIAANPGSWFSRTFVEFYIKHQKEKWRYLVHTCSSDEVLKRTENGLAEIGFLYVFRENGSAFHYELKRRNLVFTALRSVHGMLYAKQKTNAASFPYVQMEQDAFTSVEQWHFENGDTLSGQETSVMTNSDYIMRMLLDQADVANISAESFYGQKGTLLDNGHGNAVYGYVKDKDRHLSPMADEFLKFIQKRLGE